MSQAGSFLDGSWNQVGFNIHWFICNTSEFHHVSSSRGMFDPAKKGLLGDENTGDQKYLLELQGTKSGE